MAVILQENVYVIIVNRLLGRVGGYFFMYLIISKIIININN